MMHCNSRCYYIVLLLLMVMTPVLAEPVLMQVLKPDDKGIHTEDSVAYVVRLDPGSFETLKIITDKNEQFVIESDPKRDTYCQTVPLHPGKNNIRVRVYTGGKKVTEEVRSLYRSSPLSKADKYPPKGYQRTFFHTREEERLCSRCHDMSVNETPNVAFIDITKSNCYLCHKTITAKEQTHAPSVNWLCTSCHKGDENRMSPSGEPLSRFLSPDPIMDTCLECHKKTKALWKDKKYRHDPAAFGSCNRCHNPHASENYYALREPVWDLCRTCHGVKPTEEVFMERFKKLYDHPMDPKNTGKKLTCAVCHNPHVSDREFFLQEYYSGDTSVCRREGR